MDTFLSNTTSVPRKNWQIHLRKLLRQPDSSRTTSRASSLSWGNWRLAYHQMDSDFMVFFCVCMRGSVYISFGDKKKISIHVNLSIFSGKQSFPILLPKNGKRSFPFLLSWFGSRSFPVPFQFPNFFKKFKNSEGIKGSTNIASISHKAFFAPPH